MSVGPQTGSPNDQDLCTDHGPIGFANGELIMQSAHFALNLHAENSVVSYASAQPSVPPGLMNHSHMFVLIVLHLWRHKSLLAVASSSLYLDYLRIAVTLCL